MFGSHDATAHRIPHRKLKSNTSAPQRSLATVRRFGHCLLNITFGVASPKKLVPCCRVVFRALKSASVSSSLLVNSFLTNPRKDLKTISKFAQLEYKLGDPERGKTIFEGIVESHPKRWDLWSIYIDMEAGQRDIISLRYAFNR
jgi:hypothetical protein